MIQQRRHVSRGIDGIGMVGDTFGNMCHPFMHAQPCQRARAEPVCAPMQQNTRQRTPRTSVHVQRNRERENERRGVRESVKGRDMAREDGLEDKYASRFTVSNLEESGVDYRGPLQKMRDAVSPITANVWTDDIKDQDGYEQRCWYLSDEVHKYSPQNIVDIDYETQRVTMDDGKIFGNDLITQCAVSATMDRAFKAEADRGLIKEW